MGKKKKEKKEKKSKKQEIPEESPCTVVLADQIVFYDSQPMLESTGVGISNDMNDVLEISGDLIYLVDHAVQADSFNVFYYDMVDIMSLVEQLAERTHS